MESIRSEHHVVQWFDSLPIKAKISLIRQFYHLYCNGADGDLRTKIKALIDRPEISYTEARAAFADNANAFKAVLKTSTMFKEFVDTVGA